MTKTDVCGIMRVKEDTDDGCSSYTVKEITASVEARRLSLFVVSVNKVNRKFDASEYQSDECNVIATNQQKLIQCKSH